MYIIIVGAGDIGTPLTEVATAGGNEVVVIERNEARAEEVATRFDCLVIHDDATTEDTLSEAGAGRADALISTTNHDATNVMVCLLAQEQDIDHIVSVVHDPEHIRLFERIGVNTVENPQRLIAEYLYRSVTRPAIEDYMRVGDTAAVFEITIDRDAPVAGRTLRAAADDDLLGPNVLIIAVERGEDDPITPRGDTVLQAGDVVTVYSGEGATPDVTDIFGHYEDRD